MDKGKEGASFMGDIADDMLQDALIDDLMEDLSQEQQDRGGYGSRMVHGWWTPKEGEEMLISEMTDSHLENCIGWIERNKSDIDKHHQAILTRAEMVAGIFDHDSVVRDIKIQIHEVDEFLKMSVMLMKEEQVERSNRTGWDRV